MLLKGFQEQSGFSKTQQKAQTSLFSLVDLGQGVTHATHQAFSEPEGSQNGSQNLSNQIFSYGELKTLARIRLQPADASRLLAAAVPRPSGCRHLQTLELGISLSVLISSSFHGHHSVCVSCGSCTC